MGLFNKNKEEKNVPVAEKPVEPAKEEVKEEVKEAPKPQPKSAPVTKLDAAAEKELKLFAEKPK